MDDAGRMALNRNLAALADGERAAFDPVYRTLWPLLVRFIAGISGDRAIAEDMAQQAMLKIFSRVSTFDASRDGLSWSMTIAFNEYQSYRRRRANALGELDETLARAGVGLGAGEAGRRHGDGRVRVARRP